MCQFSYLKHLCETIKATSDFSCNTVCVINLFSCTKCRLEYIGQTTRKFNIRMKEHLYSIKNTTDNIIGTRFNLPGHSLDHFLTHIIEKVMPNTPRDGVIIEWPLNGLFHYAPDIILTSQTDVRDMEDNDNEPTLGTQIKHHKLLKRRFLYLPRCSYHLLYQAKPLYP